MLTHRPQTRADIVKISAPIAAKIDDVRDLFEEVYNKFPGISQKMAMGIVVGASKGPAYMGSVRMLSPDGIQHISVFVEIIDEKQGVRGSTIQRASVREGKSDERKNFIFNPAVVLFAIPILRSADEQKVVTRQIVFEVLDHELSHVRTMLFDPRHRKASFAIRESADAEGNEAARDFVAMLLNLYLTVAKSKGEPYIRTPPQYNTMEKKVDYLLRKMDRAGVLERAAAVYSLTVPQARAVFQHQARKSHEHFGIKNPTREYLREDDEIRSFTLNVINETVRALHRTKACGELRELRNRGGDTGACILRVMRESSPSYQALKTHLRKSELERVEREAFKVLSKNFFVKEDPLAGKKSRHAT